MHIVELLFKQVVQRIFLLGLIPRKCTWQGALRAVGKTAKAAKQLWQALKCMQNAGAFYVEAETIPAAVMAAISPQTQLITTSLGSGSDDVIYLFQNDICGEQVAGPRHARAFGNLHNLYQQIKQERRKVLSAFVKAAEIGQYPSSNGVVQMENTPFEALLRYLAKQH